MAISFDFDNPLAAFQDGYNSAEKIRQNIGRRQAGRALASGDYGGAANILGGIGDIGGVRQVQADQQAVVDRRQKESKAKLETLGRVASALMRVPEAERAASFQRFAPHLAQVGFSSDEIAKGGADLSDYALQTTATVAGEELQKMTVGGSAETGYFAYDSRDPAGTMKPLTPPAPRKPNWQEMKRADGSSYYVDMNAFAPGPGGVATAVDGSGPSRSSPALGGASQNGASQPRGLRNNNPLNLEATVNWDGMTGSDGRFAQFSDVNAGWAAADRNLQTYASKYGINTVAGIINRWAPPSENDSGAYAAQVARAVGVQPGDQINMADPGVRRRVLEAMAVVENGQAVTWGSSQAAGPAVGGSPQPRPTVIPGNEAPRAEWVDEPDGSQRNIRTGERKDRPASIITAERKAQERAEKLSDATEARKQKATAIISTIDKVLPMVTWDSSGMVGKSLQETAGTKAYNVRSQIETIKANLGFQELAEMRANSPTGGALGQVAVQELIALQSTVANLDIGQSTEQLKDNLTKVRTHYQNWLNAVNKANAAPAGNGDLLSQARDAINRGADRGKVIERLLQRGVNPAGL